MDKRIKVLLVFLGTMSLAAVGISVWIFLAAKSEVAEYSKKQTDLEKQNTNLQETLDSQRSEARHWQEKSEDLNASLNELRSKLAYLQNQYSALNKEKDSLLLEKQNLSAQLNRLDKLYSQTDEKTKQSSSDELLASILEEKAVLEVQVENLKAEGASLQGRIKEKETETQPIKEKFTQLEQEVATLSKKLSDAQKVADILSNDLLRERRAQSGLQAQLAKTQEQIRDIAQDRDRLSDQLVKTKQALEQRLAELDQTKAVLTDTVEGVKQVVKEGPASVQLSPIVVKAEPTVMEKSFLREIIEEQPARDVRGQKFSPSAKLVKLPQVKAKIPEPSGRIISINERHGFVVIDIGTDEEVKIGMLLDVYRNDKKVGRLEVIETRKNIAACDVKEKSVRDLKVDDNVLIAQ